MHRTLCIVLAVTGIHVCTNLPTAQDPPLTFTRHVAPILFRQCAACHRPEDPTPFSLLTYDTVRQRADRITTITASHRIPPWKADLVDKPFIDHTPLTDTELSTIQQ